MSALPRLRSALSALVVDNAVARKDILVLTRQRGALVALVLAFVVGLIVAASVALEAASAIDSALYRTSLFPFGRTLTAAVACVALALSSLLVPVLASTTVVGERESGTLRLLLTTALTPGGIVLGKLLAVLHGVAAPLLLAIPLLASGAMFGAVSVADVLFCAALLVVNVVALASVGVAASATSERVRTAPGKGLALALPLVWGPIGVPSLVLVVVWAAEGYQPEMFAGAALLLSWAVVVGSGALLIARDAIAPSSAIATPGRRRLVAAALVLPPLLAAASLFGVPAPTATDVEVWSTLYLLGCGVLALLVVLAEVSLRPADGRGAWQAAARVGALSSLGAVLAALVARTSVGVVIDHERLVEELVPLPVALGCALAVALWLTAAACIGAWFTRRSSSPARRMAASVATLGALWFLPALFVGMPGALRTMIPFIDPANLIAALSRGVVEPAGTPWGATAFASVEGALVVWALLSLGVGAMAFRERVLARR